MDPEKNVECKAFYFVLNQRLRKNVSLISMVPSLEVGDVRMNRVSMSRCVAMGRMVDKSEHARHIR